MADSTPNKPNLPWKTRFFTTILGYGVDWCCYPNGTVNRKLISFVEMPKVTAPSAVPIDGVTSRDMIYDPSNNLLFRLYVPVDSRPDSKFPVFVYFHGGGFFSGRPDLEMIDMHCRRLAASVRVVLVSVKYRLAPEHRLPAQFEDGFNVLRWLDENGGDLPGCADVGRCFLAGDSCGGNISHHVAVQVGQNGGFKRVRLAGVVVVQPFLGGEEHTESELSIDAGDVNVKRIDIWWKIALPEGSNRDHEYVNIFGPNSTVDFSRLTFPPMMVVIGGFDPLKDWQRRYYNGLKDAGKEVSLVEYPNAIHGFTRFRELPEASQFIRDLKTFIQKHQ